MKSFIIAVFFTLIAASAQAGLSTGPKQSVAVTKASVLTNSVSAPKSVSAPRQVKKVKKKHKQRREDDDDIRIDVD